MPVFATVLLALSGFAGQARAQDCGVLKSSASAQLPLYSASPLALTTAGASGHLYVLTQWGIARANLSNPASAGPFSLGQVGLQYVGTAPDYNGGKVRIVGDCHQGGTTFDAAEAPDGSARMISDWAANTCAGNMAGLAGQVVKADGVGDAVFGQQVNIATVPIGWSLAAVSLPGGRFVGYFPSGLALQVVDLTAPTGIPGLGYLGDPSASDPALGLQPFASFGWTYTSVMKAAAVSVSGLEKYLLAGNPTGRLAVAEIDSSTGVPTETASVSGSTSALSIANVDGHAFIFSAEASGIQVYEYVSGSLARVPGGTIPGDFRSVLVRGGGGPFPAIFAYSNAPNSIDIYDTAWLTQGGSAHRAYSLSQQGLRFGVFEAIVTESGSGTTAHVYELKNPPVPNEENYVQTDTLDITCVASSTDGGCGVACIDAGAAVGDGGDPSEDGGGAERTDAGMDHDGSSDLTAGCGCTAARTQGSQWLLALLLLRTARRTRNRR